MSDPNSPRSEHEDGQTNNSNSEDLGQAEQVTNAIANSLFGENPQTAQEEEDQNPEEHSSHNRTPNRSGGSTANREEEEDSNNEEENYNEEQNSPYKSASRSQSSSSAYSTSHQSVSGSKRNSARGNTQPVKRKTVRRQKQPDEPPQEEVDAALDLLLHGVPPEDFDPATLRCCIKQLQELKKDSVANKNYREANYYSELIKSSMKASDIAGFSTQCTQKLGYLMEKQADAQEKVDEINENWIQQFQEFESMIDAKMQALTEQQTRELEEFDQNMPDDLPPKYLKHSDAYVMMRKKERLLIRNEDYLAADEVKKKADALEKEELTIQHMKLQDDLLRERNALIKKHNQQYEAFALWMNSKRHDMLNFRDKDLEGPVRRLEHYTRLVDKIEKKGLPPNPYYGFTTNRVSRKESIRAVRTAAQTPLDRDTKPRQPREKPVIPNYRPSSAMRTQKLNKTKTISSKNSQRSNLPPY
ncbi:hypothetical protein TRFO_17233 [Tritrichomonas foetus]|uniref:Uncharacterized protein n=1 Tax=Tritrichomonas foetus TaxID=1144522 RepID=A0A1J4KNG4_9EUKA|nr:hypothetical protein TRFO_17233 [Tritrichomonas foetus]|eukprot:OHT12779.1 hypothetical protein TRFO_17233 [Tritrichomonas foetus]